MKCSSIGIIFVLLMLGGCSGMDKTSIPYAIENGKDVLLSISDSSVAKELINHNRWISYNKAVKGSGGKLETTHKPVVEVFEISGGGLKEPLIVKFTRQVTDVKITNPYTVQVPPNDPSTHPGYETAADITKTLTMGVLAWKGFETLDSIVGAGLAGAGGNQVYNGSYSPVNSNNDLKGGSTFAPSGDNMFGSKRDSDWSTPLVFPTE